MSFRATSFSCLLLALVADSCAPTAATSQSPGVESVAQPSRTLVIIARFEPNSLSAKEIPSSTSSAGPTNAYLNAALTTIDERGIAHPYLAQDLPRLNTETWKVTADGQMETIYRLRPGATWHNGTLLTSDDFVISWQAYATPEFGHAGSSPLLEMAEVSAADPATLLVRWRRPYPHADRLANNFPPLPRHLLQESFQRGPNDAFANNPYWTTEYIGLGPWRLDRWEPGAFVESVAFDNHVLGRPKIDRVKLVFNGDSNAVLAALLAGQAHISFDYAIYPEQAVVLKQQQWEGSILNVPTGWRRIDTQHRPEYVNPKALQDVRVRRALAQGIDRDALNEAVYLGESILTDTPISAAEPYYAELQRVVPRYPYDLRRVDQLMTEAGFTKGPDGAYTSPSEGRLEIEARANSTEALIKELAIIASGWRQSGFAVREVAAPLAMAQNNEYRATFPAFYVGQGSAGESIFNGFISSRAGRPENNWVGSNRGGFSHSEFDRLYESSTRADSSVGGLLSSICARKGNSPEMGPTVASMLPSNVRSSI